MIQFKTASRSTDELKSAKAELDEMFSVVKGKNGRINPKGVKEIEDARYDLAELMIQLVSDTVLMTDPTPFLVDVVDGNFGDDYAWQEMDAALRVVSRSYGTKPLSQRLTFKEYTMSTSGKEIAVEVPLEDVAAGRVTASMVTDAIADAVNRYRIVSILDALDAGVPSGADHTGLAGYTLRYSGLTQANLDKALDGLLDESESPAIFGRHTALAPAIRGFTGWADTTQAIFDLRGMIGTYHGAPVVTLRDQYHKREAGHLLSNKKVWIASGTKGAKFMSKDVSFLNWSVVDARTSTFGTGMRIEDGLLVTDAYQYRIITIA